MAKRTPDDPASAPKSAIERDAARIIGRRPLFARELVDRLVAKGHDPAAAERLAMEFRERGVLNDQALAEGVAQSAMGKTLAADETARRLSRRGVDPVTARAVVDSAQSLDGRTDHERALDLGRARLSGSLSRLPPVTQRRRLFGLLARRGFDEELAREVVAELVPQASDSVGP